MEWTKVLYALIITLLYIPLAFMGANVFFPKFDQFDYYQGKDCYAPMQRAMPDGKVSTEEQLAYDQRVRECNEAQEKERKAWEEKKRTYDSQKYIFIVAVNLVALLAAIFITLDTSILFGLFLGSTITTFFSTWIYFNTKSKIGFIVLVVIFIASVYFVNRQKSIVWKKLKKR
ncbi:hypothetical protein HYS47_04460 [Candidatus Woesearchaeota archaeon]|nr:hypothetical protein [Candidatus Woesearchaeota archaeon]